MNAFNKSLLLFTWLFTACFALRAQTEHDKSGMKVKLSAEVSGKYYYDIGYKYLRKRVYDSAVSYLLPALSYYKQAARPEEQAKVQNDLSLAYTELGFYNEALTLSLEALEYFEKANDSLKVASVQINTGQLYNTMEQYTKAEQYLKAAKQILLRQQKSPKLSSLLASAYNNLGTALLNNNHSDSALHYYNKALQIKYEIGNDQSTSYTLNNIGTVYSENKQYDEALHFFRQSLALKQKAGNTIGIARSYNNIGNVFLQQKENSKAKSYFDSAYALANNENNPGLMADVYANMSKVHAAMGQYETAYRYQSQYVIINDTLNNVAIAERTAELQTVYEVYKKDKELQASQARINLLKAESLARTNRFAFLASITLALIVVLLLLVRILRLRKRNFLQKETLLLHLQQVKEMENSNLKTEIDQKNQDLSSLSLQFLHKKEMIQRVKDELNTINSSESKPFTITRLSRHIDNIYPEEEDWTTFKTNFEKAHPGFFEKLGALSGNISLLDLRHCAYIRIGLITKEIANLLNIAPESVQKSRVRLKKKLGLDKETDLIVFIKNL
jgi:tetratricopeptide (TPR) repeat protein